MSLLVKLNLFAAAANAAVVVGVCLSGMASTLTVANAACVVLNLAVAARFWERR
jgi:hypothetical protein